MIIQKKKKRIYTDNEPCIYEILINRNKTQMKLA